MALRKPAAQRFHLPPLSVLRAVWKQKATVCVLFLAGSAITAAVTYEWPATYKSEAVILVESQRIPQTFVAATVNDDLKERLSNLSAQILAYSRLLAIVKKFDLYHKERRTKVEEEIIEQMRGDIDIQLVKGWSPERPGAFKIAYQGENSNLVALVANELGNLFIAENLRARDMQATGTEEFLDNQLAESKKRLEEQEAKLSQYKVEHEGELPEQENSLIASLNRLQVQLQGVQDALSRAQQDQVLIENSLQSGQATAAMMARFAKRTDVNSDPSGVNDDPRSIKKLEAKLAELRDRYTEDHPDVQFAKAELAAARKRVAAAQEEEQKNSAASVTADVVSATAEIDDPLLAANIAHERERVDNLKAQKDIASKKIATLNADRQRILAQISSIQAHVDRLPVREQQLASVMRDYEITKTNYQSLLDKKLAAGVAADMEKRQKSERFTMLEPARVAEVPFKPNRPLWAGIGGAISLLLAAAIPIVRTLHENVLLGEWELPRDTVVLGRVPVITLTGIPEDSNPNLLKRSLTAKFGLAFVIAIVVLGIGTTLYLHWFSV